jgi:hypothetical protein
MRRSGEGSSAFQGSKTTSIQAFTCFINSFSPVAELVQISKAITTTNVFTILRILWFDGLCDAGERASMQAPPGPFNTAMHFRATNGTPGTDLANLSIY